VIEIHKAAEFVVNLLKRPVVTKYDQEAEERFYNSLYNIMSSYSKDGKYLNEDQFCSLMQTFEV
jgi:pyocin large subunit-like protein